MRRASAYSASIVATGGMKIADVMLIQPNLPSPTSGVVGPQNRNNTMGGPDNTGAATTYLIGGAVWDLLFATAQILTIRTTVRTAPMILAHH